MKLSEQLTPDRVAQAVTGLLCLAVGFGLAVVIVGRPKKKTKK